MPRVSGEIKKVTRYNKNGKRVYYRKRIYKTDDHDVRKRVDVYGKTVEEVKAKALKVEAREIASFKAEKQTVSQYLERWLTRVENRNAPRTHERYNSVVEKYIKPGIGGLRLAKVRRSDIQELLEHRLGKIGPRTRQQTYTILHRALEEAVEDELIRANPCHRKDKPKYEDPQIKSLTEEEAHALLKAASEPNLYVLAYLALSTGMRQGEILGLKWEHVDRKNGFISVCGTLTKNKEGKLVIRETKGKRNRRVDISPALVSMLDAHHKRQSPLSLWVFPNSDGGPMRKDNLMHRQFRPLFKSAGLVGVRFHDLRHTSATLGLAAGDNVKIIQERLGHASAKTTLDVYAKAVPSLQRESATRMDSILGAYGGTSGARLENARPENAETLMK